MSNIMGNYETIFIVDVTQGEEEVTATIEKFKSLIEKNGTIEKVDDWGKRRLAYPINDLNEGYYTLITFSAPHDFPLELDRIYKITDGIMRSNIIKK